ncbi:uncharacterized protein MELLADRAFT_91984 [Melampsora larici-populina 98AG31]|uniref:NADH-ubiquinone oxidoreductase chain 2 n=1 Tax=Melampsora larici-populina (strain 98AG31 / pathotype 3-4-7) TaxID=747676 RepID=F4SEL8_MELLP|nr:uncharacterized protein MELLADRAFT_91984 [Melampsora larici-populina 98AG31]EGF96909.1 hypothetical protein MELLADRAFT_91984 [Melampsora larici-populina 98AG31]
MEVLLFMPHQYEEGTGWRDGSQSTMPKEYSLVVIFSVIGASIILSSYNLISIYLATELQSFALYIIAALSRDSLSSAFILLGAGIIYTCTGSTSLANMSNWISTPDVYQNTPTVVTIMLITIPKISIMTALYTLTQEFYKYEGTVTGLVQTQLRRLLAFSTISHVGFIVLMSKSRDRIK